MLSDSGRARKILFACRTANLRTIVGSGWERWDEAADERGETRIKQKHRRRQRLIPALIRVHPRLILLGLPPHSSTTYCLQGVTLLAVLSLALISLLL